jgi:prepilin-type N-terminal cleavage/methylation domain-containing protein
MGYGEYSPLAIHQRNAQREGCWGMGYREYPILPLYGKNTKSHVVCTPHTPYPIPHTLKFRNGFGLIEVMAAAVVLGFLIVGLSNLQKGNREAVLRVRARDAANIVAQHVLDSLSTIGLNSLVPDTGGIIVNDVYIYNFEGKPQLDKNSAGIKTTVQYTVQVKLLAEAAGDIRSSVESTYFTVANRSSGSTAGDDEINVFAKGLEATVSWPFKNNSTQSIKVARVVR